MRVTGRSNEITVTSPSYVRAGRVAPGRWLWPLRPSSRPSSEAIRPSAAGWCDYGERGQPASSTCLLSQQVGFVCPRRTITVDLWHWSELLWFFISIFINHYFQSVLKLSVWLTGSATTSSNSGTTQVTWWGATGLRPVAASQTDG